METPSQTKLLVRKGFLALFATQLLSAFNDNFLKNAVVIWISATRAQLFGLSPEVMISLCSGVFIVPFFLFSATAGQLADRYEKPRLIRYIKLAEIGILALATLGFLRADLTLLMAAIFLLGVHSTFLGPIKYSILPQMVAPDELVAGNALVEMGTFLAILAGTIGGGLLVLLDRGPLLVGGAGMFWAALGYLASRRIPRLAPVAPELRLNWSPIGPTLEILRITGKTRAVFLSALGISWFWFFGASFLSVLPTYARVTLGAHEHVVTLFLAVFCVGIAIGSLFCEKVSGKNLELGLVPFGSIGMTLFTLDLYFVGAPEHAAGVALEVGGFIHSPHALRILVDLFGIALFGGFYTVPLYTLIQQRAEPAERSRVVAGNNILNAIFMVAASLLLAFLFGREISVPHIFLITAGLNALVAIYIYSLLPEFLLRFIAWILSRTLYRLTLRGHELVPETGPAVLVCNHVSFVDFLIIAGSIRRPVRFVMDHRIAATPVVSALFKQGKTIPIAPEREDKALLERAFERIAAELREGEIVCIFPEGKLTRDGEMNPFRAGIERIIRETPVPVVPMALAGLWGSMFSRKQAAGVKLPRRFRSKLRLEIGEAIPAERVSAAGLEERVRELLAIAEGLPPAAAAPAAQ
ncbi:MAG TPA: MFS transporter [Polyangiales bacterium]|nr:MFS transporter [Polyangiales bacterium]